jgi:hypothetical protein
MVSAKHTRKGTVSSSFLKKWTMCIHVFLIHIPSFIPIVIYSMAFNYMKNKGLLWFWNHSCYNLHFSPFVCSCNKDNQSPKPSHRLLDKQIMKTLTTMMTTLEVDSSNTITKWRPSSSLIRQKPTMINTESTHCWHQFQNSRIKLHRLVYLQHHHKY